MKTKEIEIWVPLHVLDDIKKHHGSKSWELRVSNVERDNFNKARLIIEIPEEKHEFTRSEIRDAMQDAAQLKIGDSLNPLLDELFGEEK
mgnify:CR=1 FL=1